MYGAVMFHGAAMLPRLRTMPREQVQKVAQEAGDISLGYPLHMAGRKTFMVPSWGEKELSGMQVVALMVFGLWVLCGEREEMCSALVESWPIREAVLLCSKLQ